MVVEEVAQGAASREKTSSLSRTTSRAVDGGGQGSRDDEGKQGDGDGDKVCFEPRPKI